MFLFIISISPVHAGAEAVPQGGDTAVGSLLDLLKEKNIISDEESAAFVRQMVYKSLAKEDLKALVDLLREKGVVTGDEAAGFIRKIAATPSTGAGKEPVAQEEDYRVREANQLILPAGDNEFILKLRELWVSKGYRKVDFDAQFGDTRDAQEIIGRMRVQGVITPAYAVKLDEFYREKFLSGAVATVLETKEKDYIDQIRKNTAWEIDEKIKERLKGEWWQNIRLSGDFRLRYEGDFFDKNNGNMLQTANPSLILNTRVNRDRFPLRLRLGVDAKLADGVSVGVGLASGTTGNPVSTNVTLGDSFNKKSLAIDKAYLKLSPDSAFTFWGGRFPNPWFYTDMVWDPDINFDGIAVQYNYQLAQSLSLFFTGGAFPLQEVEFSGKDKWLFGGQAGFKYKGSGNLTAKLGVALYDFENTVGIPNDPTRPGVTDWTAPQFQQKGNTLLDIDPTSVMKTAYASEFRELNITGSVDLGYWDPVHVVLVADYVNNLGFKQDDVEARTGSTVKKETKGYHLGVMVGYPTVQDFAEWKGLLSYKYLGGDAVMDAFTDSDFHLGGTNAKGWIIGGDFGLNKNVWLSAKWLSANEISGPPLGIDVFQFNLNGKF
jgi:hypothetical protein